MNDDLVERVIQSVQAVVTKAVADAEARFETRLQERLTPLEDQAKQIVGLVEGLPEPKDGRDGKDGRDIDYEAITRDLIAMVDAAVAKLPPPEPGKQGEKGEDGISPEPAAIIELARPEIEKEIALCFAALPPSKNGTDGQDGQDGQPGERGEAGRDAAELDILKGISNERSYARGTWASFDGSLWVATRQTVPLADKSNDNGWRCVVAGIGMIAFDFDVESRALRVKWKQGDMESVRAIEMPVLLDRGVYRHGSEYRSGDVVSEDGSAWAARESTSDRPGTSKAWRLLVMRGRNGRDAERAARVEEPVRLR